MVFDVFFQINFPKLVFLCTDRLLKSGNTSFEKVSDYIYAITDSSVHITTARAHIFIREFFDAKTTQFIGNIATKILRQ